MMVEKELEQLNQLVLVVEEIRKGQILQGQILAVHGEKLSSIETQVKATNGAVGRHELAIHEQTLVCANRKSIGDEIPDIKARVLSLEKEQSKMAAADAVVTAAASAKEKVDSDWKERLRPLAIALIGALAGIFWMITLNNAHIFIPKKP
jgi:hypothetical protein